MCLSNLSDYSVRLETSQLAYQGQIYRQHIYAKVSQIHALGKHRLQYMLNVGGGPPLGMPENHDAKLLVKSELVSPNRSTKRCI